MIKYWLVVFLLILTLFQVAYAADSITLNFDGTMKSESKTIEGKKDAERTLNQVYHLDLRKDITSKIYFTAYAGANATEDTEETEETDGTETTRLSPQFRLNIANDYFNANGGYLLNETGIDMFGIHPTEQSRLTTETWTSNFSTKSLKYPNIRFRYDEQRNYDHLSVHSQDSLSKYYELLGDYTYKFVEFTLRHSKDKNYDYVKDTDDITTVNEGRINFRESFWGSRITTSGTYTVTNTEKENVTSTDTTSTDETRKDLIFDAGLNLRPFKWCRISYNYELDDTGAKEDTDIDTDADTDTDVEEITSTDIDQTVHAHNISIRGDARLHKYLNSWAQYRKRLEYNSEQDDTSTDTFTLNFNSTPIETLNANLIFNHLINKTESETQSETSSMLLHIIANIWEGVDLSVDGQINYTDNIVGDTKTLSKTINSDLRLKLTKTLTTEINYITEWTDTKNSDGTEISTSNYTIGTDLYYRPVQSFYFKFSCELQKNENAEDLTYYISDINWIMTEKLRANLQYKVDKNSRDDTKFSSDLVWNMSKIFVLKFNYDWSREKENDIFTKINAFTTSISAKF